MKSGAHGNQIREHLLLTVLGTNPRSARYALGDREAEAPLAAVALFELLPEEDRPDRVLALCTREAEQNSLPLFAGAPGVQLPVEALRVACPVRRFGLIDRRPAGQQGADPYQTGEPFWLDSSEEGDGDRD